MADIPASTVMKLRKMSGQGMMDCKKALNETEGDLEKALEILRKKGLATLEKRAGRETSEGIVVTKSTGNSSILATLCCETDFVSKSEDFLKTADVLSDYALACEAEQGAEAVLATSVDGVTFEKVLTDLVSKTGEKTEVGEFTRYTSDASSVVSSYVHFNKKIGTMVQIECSSESVAESDDFRQAASDIAMHITAVNPLALDKDGLDPEMVQKEKAVYAEQVKNKPAEIIDKIVEGKLNKFYAERCLLSQPFVKDDSKTVKEVIDEAAKAAGGEAKIRKYVRLSVES